MELLKLAIKVQKNPGEDFQLAHEFSHKATEEVKVEDSVESKRNFMKYTVEALEKLKQNTDEYLTKLIEGKCMIRG